MMIWRAPSRISQAVYLYSARERRAVIGPGRPDLSADADEATCPFCEARVERANLR